VIEVMDESASQTSSMDQPWKRVFEAPSRRVYPVPNGSLWEHALPSARVQELAEPPRSPTSLLREHALPSTRVQELAEQPQVSNGSLWERSLPSVRVQELVEPLQIPNGSLRERSPPGARVQEIVEPLQPPNSLEFWQIQPLDELRQLAAELNRRLELGMASSTVRRGGPTGERFFQRFIDEGTPSVVRPVTFVSKHQAITMVRLTAFALALSVAFTLVKAQPIAWLSQRLQKSIIQPELTKNGRFFCQGQDQLPLMSRNAPDRK